MPVAEAVFDSERLAAVRATGLLDTPAEEAFDQLADMAGRLLEAPFAFVTIVDSRRSYWKSCIGVGIAGDNTVDRQNTVEESFCQYVVGSGEKLIVGDTTADPRTRDNPSIEAMGVQAWAGYPVLSPNGDILGTFCVVDTKTREWTEQEEHVLATLSEAASREIALRAAMDASDALARSLQASLLPPPLPIVPGWTSSPATRRPGPALKSSGTSMTCSRSPPTAGASRSGTCAERASRRRRSRRSRATRFAPWH